MDLNIPCRQIVYGIKFFLQILAINEFLNDQIPCIETRLYLEITLDNSFLLKFLNSLSSLISISNSFNKLYFLKKFLSERHT